MEVPIMRALRLALVVCAAVLVGQSSVQADGWWPFGGDSAVPKKKGPSVFSRAGSSTKSFFKKTGQALSPKKKPTTVSKFPSWSQNTATKQTSHSRNKKKKKSEEQGSWFGNMFGAEEEPRPPQTAQEFLALPRPGEDF